MLSGADAKQLYEDKKNILTVKKKKKPLYIYIPFLRKMQEKFTYLDQLLYSVYALITGYMKN